MTSARAPAALAGGPGRKDRGTTRSRRSTLPVLLWTLTLSACTSAPAPGSSALVLRNVTLIDGTGAPPRPSTTVIIRGDRIDQVGPSDRVRMPAGARIVDGSGLHVIPGLWDLHVHLSKAGEHVAPLFLAAGVTGVRDMGGDAERVARMKASVAAGETPGPRIVMAGPIVESAAYMRNAAERGVLEPIERFRVGAATPGRARAVVDSLAALGVDFVKLRTFDSLATYRALADAASAAGLDLVGHAQGLAAEEVLRARQRSVEHALFPFLSERDSTEASALARELAEAGTAFVPTLVTFRHSALVPARDLVKVLGDTAGVDEPRRRYLAGFLVDDWEEQLEERIEAEEGGESMPWGMLHAGQLADLRLLHRAGAPILPGTDVAVVGVFPGSSLHDELRLLVEEVGLTPMEALEAATRGAATLLGLQDELGTVEPGRKADLVLLSADPLADVRHTRSVAGVVREGVYYDREALDALRERVAAAADSIRGAVQVPSGSYVLAAEVGDRTFPVELDLLEVEGRPWGRLTVGGVGQVVAVRGIDADGTRWTFAAGGPVRQVRLDFAAAVTGTLELGGAPPFALRGERVGDVVDPDALRAQHALAGLGLAEPAGRQGTSFPAGTPEGHLLFARHGPDLSRQTLMETRPAGDGWERPRVLDLSGTHGDRSPFVLPDGSGLVFASDRPAPSGEAPDGYRLWFAARVGPRSWGRPRPVAIEGGWPHDARQPAVTADGTLYFSSDATGGRGDGDVWSAAPIGPARWAAPRNLGAPVNSAADEHGAFVAPDGSYMLLTSSGPRAGARGGDDLYLSVWTADGWSEPRALPLPVNTFANEYGPWVSATDGQLYFTSDRYGYSRIFRVDPRRAGLAEASGSSAVEGNTEMAGRFEQ